MNLNQPIHGNQVNRIILKPRFKVSVDAPQKAVLKDFEDTFKSGNCPYCSKIVGHHIVLDVPIKQSHFWSPQLHLEVEKDNDKTTVIKALLGPKPQIWTFFMFLHFAVAIAFLIFLVIAYSNYTLDKDYGFALTMDIVLPVVWLVFYIGGQLGKKKGYKQMQELHDYLMETLSKYQRASSK
ncbi:MAG: GTP-binding protein [Flavobacteriaceae bacterium]